MTACHLKLQLDRFASSLAIELRIWKTVTGTNNHVVSQQLNAIQSSGIANVVPSMIGVIVI